MTVIPKDDGHDQPMVPCGSPDTSIVAASLSASPLPAAPTSVFTGVDDTPGVI